MRPLPDNPPSRLSRAADRARRHRRAAADDRSGRQPRRRWCRRACSASSASASVSAFATSRRIAASISRRLDCRRANPPADGAMTFLAGDTVLIVEHAADAPRRCRLRRQGLALHHVSGVRGRPRARLRAGPWRPRSARAGDARDHGADFDGARSRRQLDRAVAARLADGIAGAFIGEASLLAAGPASAIYGIDLRARVKARNAAGVAASRRSILRDRADAFGADWRCSSRAHCLHCRSSCAAFLTWMRRASPDDKLTSIAKIRCGE